MLTPFSHFQPIAELPGELGFTIWGLGTRDSLDVILKPGYFDSKARLIVDGDIIIVNRRLSPVAPRPSTEKTILIAHKDGQGQVVAHRLAGVPSMLNGAALAAAVPEPEAART